MTALKLRDLTVAYAGDDGPIRAVRGVDLTVEASASLGLAGESGCGKSTVAMSVLRLLPPSAAVTGEVRLDDTDVLTMRWGQLRAVRWAGASIVFQGALHSLNAVQRIGAQIAEPLLLHSVGERTTREQRQQADLQAQDLLAQVGLPGWRHASYPHELSGGQKQRVMIAMALACQPQVIIADEPTTALDVVIQAGILRTLRDLVADRGVALVVISHDLAVLSATCHRVAVMYAGRIVESGPGASVFSAAQHPYTQGLAAAFPTIGDPASRMHPSGLAGDPPDLADTIIGCAFAPRCSRATDRCLTEDPALEVVGTDKSRRDVGTDEPRRDVGTDETRRVACWHPGGEEANR